MQMILLQFVPQNQISSPSHNTVKPEHKYGLHICFKFYLSLPSKGKSTTFHVDAQSMLMVTVVN